MRVIIFIAFLCVLHVEGQFWSYPQKFLSTLFRQGKTESDKVKIASSADTASPVTEFVRGTTRHYPESTLIPVSTDATAELKTSDFEISDGTETPTKSVPSTVAVTTPNTSKDKNVTAAETKSTSITTQFSTVTEVTTLQMNTTNEERKSNQKHEMYLSKREKPQIKISSNISQNLLPLPAGASAALVKPTKYHYYPHNQHIYLLPECAIQQVCNAVYIRLNWTQPLCACPSRYRDPCSASLNADDLHTTELMMDRKSRRALTLVKTCEPIADMRVCHSPRDWSLLALQNIRTGKSHYLVICRCPDTSVLEGPMSHDQPTYASVPGIRVYGMMCVDAKRKRSSRSYDMDALLMVKAHEFAKKISWI